MRRRGCPATPARGRQGPVPPALRACTPFTRPPEHPPGPSLLAGPVVPAAGQSPPIGRPPKEGHWSTGTGTGTDWPPCCSRLTGRWANGAHPLAASALWPGPSAYWSGVRQSSTHAPLPLLHPLCCTRRRTLTLTLSYSHARSAAQVCLSSSACRPLSSLFLPPPPPPNLPYTSSTIHTFPTRDRPLCLPSPHESTAFMVCFVFFPLPASSESPCPSRRILSSP